jgi:hypothetical protein
VSHAREAIEGGSQTPAGMAAVLGVDHSTLWRALRKHPAPTTYAADRRAALGSRLDQHQKAMTAASARAEA